MKILFLDIDGVLNSELWYTHAHYCITHDKKNEIYSDESSNENDRHVDYNIDPRLIENLNLIIEKTGCEIVLSSSWRCPDKEEMTLLNSQLRRKGLIKEYFDVTPYSRSRIRGEEIKEWLNKNCKQLEITSFCIIDDDSDMLEEQKKFFVNTDSYIGLTSHDADMAIEILNRI